MATSPGAGGAGPYGRSFFAHHLLWKKAGGGKKHLDAARTILDEMLALQDADTRKAMLAAYPEYREVRKK